MIDNIFNGANRDTPRRYLRSNIDCMLEPCRRAANKKCDELSVNVNAESALANCALAKNISDTVVHYNSLSNTIVNNMTDYTGIKAISEVAAELYDNSNEVEIYMTGYADAVTNSQTGIDLLKDRLRLYDSIIGANHWQVGADTRLIYNLIYGDNVPKDLKITLPNAIKELSNIAKHYNKPLVNLTKKTWLQKLINYVKTATSSK